MSLATSVPERPALRIANSQTSTVLSWTSADGAYQVEETAALGSDAKWTAVSADVSHSDGQNTVSVPLAGGARFYRLTPHE
jgi:hypothetical protein